MEVCRWTLHALMRVDPRGVLKARSGTEVLADADVVLVSVERRPGACVVTLRPDEALGLAHELIEAASELKDVRQTTDSQTRDERFNVNYRRTLVEHRDD